MIDLADTTLVFAYDTGEVATGDLRRLESLLRSDFYGHNDDDSRPTIYANAAGELRRLALVPVGNYTDGDDYIHYSLRLDGGDGFRSADVTVTIDGRA